MARRPGETWPSDRRGYFFEYYEELLDDPVFEEVSADAFRFRINLRAMLKRSRSRDGTIVLSRRALCRCAVREKYKAALKIAEEGAKAGLWELVSKSEDGAQTVLCVPNWPNEQRFAPSEPQSSPDESPQTETGTGTGTDPETGTETETETETETRRAGREAESAGGQKPTRTLRCSCPAELTDVEIRAAIEALRFDGYEGELTPAEIAAAWEDFRSRSPGTMTREKWVSEFWTALRLRYPAPPPPGSTRARKLIPVPGAGTPPRSHRDEAANG